MKKIIILSSILLLISCNQESKSKYKLAVTAYNGSGLDRARHVIHCDSVNMLSTKKAEVFIDGTKMNIEAENYITVRSR